MKFMSMKRFGSIVMAGAMALSLVVPAFAETAAATPNQTVVDGNYVAPVISVLVPATGTAQVNPYGLPVTVGAKADGTLIQVVGEQISNTPMYLGNYGTIDLDVNATLAVIPTGDVEIKPTYAAGTDKGKQMKVTLEVKGLDDSKYAKVIDNEALVLSLYEAYAIDATWTGAESLVAPAAAKGATTVANPAKSASAMATLGAATVNTSDDGTSTITYGDDSVALFRLVGEMNEEPEKTEGGNQVEDPWVAADGFKATIVFKFKPHTAPATPSAGDASVSVSISGTTATATFSAGTSGLTAASYAWSSDTTSTATVTGTTATGTITQDGGASAGDTAEISVTVTLSNGATVTGSATYTAT